MEKENTIRSQEPLSVFSAASFRAYTFSGKPFPLL